MEGLDSRNLKNGLENSGVLLEAKFRAMVKNDQQYKPRKDSAPRLVAKGKGWMAEKIIQTAREHNISLKEDHI